MTPIAQGQCVSKDLIAPLRDSLADIGSAETLNKRIAAEGYLFFRRFFDPEEVKRTRTDVFSSLAAVGEIVGEPAHGIFSGKSERREKAKDLGVFWRSVSEQWSLRRISHGTDLHNLAGRILGESARAQDYVFLRPTNPGKFTHLHCDAPFFTRETTDVVTVWIALSDVPVSLGPLFIVAGSHQDPSVQAHYKDFDVARDTNRQAALVQTPRDYASKHSTQLLTTDFAAGDIVVFGMHTLHGTFDNTDPDGKCRLSCDVRYQPAAAPQDPRYFGPNPSGTTGAGYGELVGAKPMTDAWHVR
ncbi:MAG: phytanoyl-CoA dioxygenase family protein [Burkholderiaceae bacterium]